MYYDGTIRIQSSFFKVPTGYYKGIISVIWDIVQNIALFLEVWVKQRELWELTFLRVEEWPFLNRKINSRVQNVPFWTDHFNYFILKAHFLSNKETPLAKW